jgi:hypothetical protein
MTSKSATAHWINYFGSQKFEGTIYEQGFQGFAESRGWAVEKGKPIDIIDGEGVLVTLTPDFQMKLGNLVDIVILVDGMKVHKWKEVNGRMQGAGKDAWRDGLYLKAKRKPIHIGGEICLQRYWNDLGPRFRDAVLSKEKVEYIAE